MNPIDDFLSTLTSPRTVARYWSALEEFTGWYRQTNGGEVDWNLLTPVEVKSCGSASDRILLRRRAIIETINDQIMTISQIEHSRHRSITNFFVNMLCGLIAYCHCPSKLSLGLDEYLPLHA